MTVKLHRITGALLALFIVSHLIVHLFAVAGPGAHANALRMIQWLYRNPFVEPALIGGMLFQIALGLRLAFRRMKEPGKSGWAKLQLASGFYIAFFIINHSGAALYTRHIGQLDTNFWWVSGTLTHPVLRLLFYPYYAFAVLAVGAHLASFLHFRGMRRASRLAILGAVPVALGVLASFGGWLFPVTPRADYRAYFDALVAAFGIG